MYQWGCHCGHEMFSSLLCLPLILSACLPSTFQVGQQLPSWCLSPSCVGVSGGEAAGVVHIYCEEPSLGPEHWAVWPHELVIQISPSAHYRWVDPARHVPSHLGSPSNKTVAGAWENPSSLKLLNNMEETTLPFCREATEWGWALMVSVVVAPPLWWPLWDWAGLTLPPWAL